jgi:hypothetical protein
MDLEKFLPTSTQTSILDELYKETDIKTRELSLEDLLRLPVNDQYRINSLNQSLFERFNLKSNDNIIKNDIYSANNNGKIC